MEAELQYLRSKVKAWVDKIRVRHLPHHLVWLSLRTGIFKTLEYPLAATTFTPLQCRELCVPLLQVGLSRSHIVRSMPRDVVYGPTEAGGFSLPNLYVEQGLAQLTAYLLFGRSSSSITGFLLRASLEHLQLEVGTSTMPLSLPYRSWSKSAVPSWLQSLWLFCDTYAIKPPTILAPPPLLRSGDRYLMDAFWQNGIRNPDSLARLNHCRLFLQVLTLADIVSVDGRYVLLDAWTGSSPCGRRSRTETWPRAPPAHALDWSLWRRCLSSTFGVDHQFRRLTSTLGTWFFPPVRETLCFYSARDNRVFVPKSMDQWQLLTAVPHRRGRRRFQPAPQYLSFGQLALQSPLFPADVVLSNSPFAVLMGHESQVFQFPLAFPRRAPCVVLDWASPELTPFTQVWFDQPALATFETLLCAVQDGRFAAVTDGSARAGLEGTAAWCVAFDPTTVAHLSAGFRIPGPPSSQCSFRSELAGLLAIARLLRACTRIAPTLSGTIHFGTDSQAVLDKIFNFPRPASLRDHSWDLVSLTRVTLDAMPSIVWRTRHIKGHQDSLTSGPLDIWARRNIAANERAEQVYHQVPMDHLPTFPEPPLPSCAIGLHEVVHDLATQLRQHALTPPLVAHWTRLGRFGSVSPDTVEWTSYSKALSYLTQARRHWMIKATAERSAVGVEMVRRRAWRTPVCPRCQQAVETAAHVCECPHVEARERWTTALARLDLWLQEHHTQPNVRRCILQALRRWLDPTVVAITPSVTTPSLAQALQEQESLGWSSMIFGFWSTAWAEAQDNYFRFLGKRNSGRRWLALLIVQLWDTAWDLWEHRNGIFHAQEAAKALESRQTAIREIYAAPPPLLTPAMQLLLRRPLAQRLTESQRIQELFIRRFTTHRTTIPVRQLRLQQTRFRQFFRPRSS